jgi:uncharacterized protein
MNSNNFYSLKTVQNALSGNALELTIFPTEQCNFRCTYCYEDFEIGKMSAETVEGIKNLISQRVFDLQQLRLVWFGGEPLIATDIMYDISQYAMELCQEHDVSLLPGSVTTNGYKLSVNVARELVRLRQSHFQISLDGIETSHNLTRQLMSGAGTFKQIMSNISALKKSDVEFTITLRLHLIPNNISDIEELINMLDYELQGDNRFDFFLKPITNLGGPNAANIKKLAPQDSEEIIARLNTKISRYAVINNNEQMQEYICYAAKPNSLLIRANGKISKCTVALNDEFNYIGEIHQDGSLTINNERLHPWLRGFSTMNPNDLQCPLDKFPDKVKPLIFIPKVKEL